MNIAGKINPSIARALTFGIEEAGKTRQQVAHEAGMHRETLQRVMRGDRPIALDEISRIVTTCGGHPKATILLVMAGQEELACQWMGSKASEFLEEFFTALPVQLDRTLGIRAMDLRPHWAKGSSELLARMLANHVEKFNDLDYAAALG